jgi:sulfite exporter TauE/SafE
MDAISLSVPAAMVLGLSFGSGPCGITCLPFLGPVFLAEAGSKSQRWKTITLFSTGRLTGYALLATASGLLGELITQWAESIWTSRLLGLATLVLGLSLWLRPRQQQSCKLPAQQEHQVQLIHQQPQPSPLTTSGLFLTGLGLALNPCTPLSTLLLAAAATASATQGLFLGLSFGLGAVLIPSLLFGTLVAHLGQQIRSNMGKWQHKLTRAAATGLMLLGGFTLLGWVKV